MRQRIFLRALLILGLVVGGGVATSSSAEAYYVDSPRIAAAADTPTTTVEVLSTTERGLCVKIGTGGYANLWHVAATHLCPRGYWTPTTMEEAFGPIAHALAGAPGPVGPAGPKGDPGDSIAKVATKTVTLNASSPATQSVVLTGLPARSSAVVELAVNNAGESPAGTTVTVTAVVAAPGSTERSFIVGTSGFTGAQTFPLSIKVLAVSA